jgi:hypothetical protein
MSNEGFKAVERMRAAISAYEAKRGPLKSAAKAVTTLMSGVQSSWRKYIAMREQRRNEHCRKLNVKRCDKPGACWSGTEKVRQAVLAKFTREQSEDKAFSRSAETAAQMADLTCIRNRTEWLDALDHFQAKCDELEARIAANPSKFRTVDLSGKK